jgi:hypothetical protein
VAQLRAAYLRYIRFLMRRSAAILLALVFNWMLILPAFAGSAEFNLPACCRKNGNHHCVMRMQSSAGSDASFAAIGEKCPYFPQSTTATHVETFGPGISQAIFAGIVRHPALETQTEAGYRASHLRSKQKRGPPSLVRS